MEEDFRAYIREHLGNPRENVFLRRYLEMIQAQQNQFEDKLQITSWKDRINTMREPNETKT